MGPLKILLGYFGTGKTTIGRLLCKKAADLKLVDNIYYIVLARDSDGDQLKKQFREEFQPENQNVNLTVWNRDECKDKFEIPHTKNEIKLIHCILEKVPESSLVFCDEAHIKID